MGEETAGQKFGTWIAILGVTFPSMIAAGFMADWNILPLWMWISISAAVAGIGVGIGYRPMIAAFLGGVIGGASIPIALVVYVVIRARLTETFVNVELLVPAVIGALPGIAVYKFVAWASGGPQHTEHPSDQMNDTNF